MCEGKYKKQRNDGESAKGELKDKTMSESNNNLSGQKQTLESLFKTETVQRLKQQH